MQFSPSGVRSIDWVAAAIVYRLRACTHFFNSLKTSLIDAKMDRNCRAWGAIYHRDAGKIAVMLHVLCTHAEN